MNSYEPQMAVTLALAIREAYRKYLNPSHVISLGHYQIKDSIYVYELEKGGDVFFGFTAEGSMSGNPPYNNLVILRGTQTDEEAIEDLWWSFVPCILPSQGGKQYGKVASGLYSFYTGTDYGFVKSLADSFKDAVSNLNASRPDWYIAGHSLGGAMATLGALDAVVSNSYHNSLVRPKLYTYGSLYVGDEQFKTSFANQGISQVYRVANLADWVPSFTGVDGSDTPGYVHVGLDCTYLWQTGGDWGNHSLEYNYLACVQNHSDVIKFGARKYPQ